uniref:Solute carrier family 5 member 8 n=1 Tax=Salarias fasciatus TaxID=181472 RepID=A0A672F727_SALFA
MAVPGVSGVSGVSVGGRSFSAADYLVFGVMLAVSAAIGVYHAWADRGRSSSEEFLTGGRRLTALPVSLSLTASFMSAITMLSNPAEVYRYGASIVFFGVSYAVMVLVTSEIFIPLFYKLSVASTYEYLELRFSRAVRLLGTVFFVAQTVLYTGIVIYAPALALNQVTGIDLWGAVVSTGVVCTFYCSVGGLKAVVWTDVFQLGVMLAGFLCVIIGSVRLQGGLASIVSDSRDGGRLVFQDFDLNPLRRHTFWTITVGGSFLWISIYGINQSQVQRYLSCRTMSHARYSLYINLLGLWLVLLCSVFSGVCLYSVYQSCDPWTTGRVAAPDQLVPYLVMDILGDYPGLPGLFVAAAYSGSLRLVNVTLDGVGVSRAPLPRVSECVPDLSSVPLALLSAGLLYGALCVAMSGVASVMGGVLQAALSITGIIGGPLLGLFTLGVLFPFANSAGALSGLVSGLAVALWVGVGAQMYPPPPEMTRPLALNTSGCNFTANAERSVLRSGLADWYSLSYLYFSVLGAVTAVGVGLLVSRLTGRPGTFCSPLAVFYDFNNNRFSFCYTKQNHPGVFGPELLSQTVGLLSVQVLRRRRKLLLASDTPKKLDNANPGFCDVELDEKLPRTLR